MVTVNEIDVTQFAVEVDPGTDIITVNIGIGSAAGGAYTSQSFAADFAAQTTDNLTEGATNLYYTGERVDDQVAGLIVGGDNTTVTYDDNLGTLTIDVATPASLETQDEGITAGSNVGTLNFTGPGVTATDVAGVTTVNIPGSPIGTTDDLTEGATNLYFTTARANSAIDTRVNKAYIDALNVDADTLDGLDSTAFATSAQGTLADTALQGADIGVTVQGYSLVLANTTASFTLADETKLDGIEPLATADQTDAEIKTAYENNLNTNAFTDAEQSKLAGIEAGATGDLTPAEIKVAYEGNLNTNAFTDAEQNKLAGIEALADVTDAANVDAAGAVMNTDTSTTAMNFVIDEDTFATNSATLVPTQQSVKSYVDNSVVGNLTYRGGYNASANIPDLDTAPSGITTGDMYTVTTAGTFFTATVEPGDALIANQNNPIDESGWTIVQTNLDAATIKTNYESNSNTNAFTDAEQTKLAGIETNATADQTGAEIKALYEGELDTNAFTDAEQTKLAGIEALATADQTPAEILAGLLTVDGTGSTLDADLLDGQQGTHYLDYNNFVNTPTIYDSTSFDADLSTKTTTDLSEGTNLYYTDVRANAAIDARVTASYINTLDITIDGGTF